MQTDSLELKKLVYLYLMNYAKTQPDMAIMAVNTFVKVILGPDPPHTSFPSRYRSLLKHPYIAQNNRDVLVTPGDTCHVCGGIFRGT